VLLHLKARTATDRRHMTRLLQCNQYLSERLSSGILHIAWSRCGQI